MGEIHGEKGSKNMKGRKLFDGKNEQEVLQKLEQVFSIDGTDEEACVYADISPAALYAYQKKHPHFQEHKKALKNLPNLKARQELVKGLTGNPELALKYLERKLKSEFAPKAELEHSGNLTGIAVNFIDGKNGDK
jgi:hypothetical protein